MSQDRADEEHGQADSCRQAQPVEPEQPHEKTGGAREFEGCQVRQRGWGESNLCGVRQHERCPGEVRDRDERVRDDAPNSGDDQYGVHESYDPTTVNGPGRTGAPTARPIRSRN